MHEPVDLRRIDVSGVLDRVSQALGVRLDRVGIVRKRRTVGVPSDRGTWVRIERRPRSRVTAQSWGTEAAAALSGVAMPAWRSSTSWRADDGAMWHADECDLVLAAPVKPAGRLLEDPGLPDGWWTALNASLDALRAQSTTRMATPDTVTITQELVSATITREFPDAGDTSVRAWHSAHADLNWANVTGSSCALLDWEDWGLAPRGLDSATLWVASLAVPALAARVWAERRADLESEDGRLMALFALAKVIAYGPADPLHDPARQAAARLLAHR